MDEGGWRLDASRLWWEDGGSVGFVLRLVLSGLVSKRAKMQEPVGIQWKLVCNLREKRSF